MVRSACFHLKIQFIVVQSSLDLLIASLDTLSIDWPLLSLELAHIASFWILKLINIIFLVIILLFQGFFIWIQIFQANFKDLHLASPIYQLLFFHKVLLVILAGLLLRFLLIRWFIKLLNSYFRCCFQLIVVQIRNLIIILSTLVLAISIKWSWSMPRVLLNFFEGSRFD